MKIPFIDTNTLNNITEIVWANCESWVTEVLPDGQTNRLIVITTGLHLPHINLYVKENYLTPKSFHPIENELTNCVKQRSVGFRASIDHTI